MWQDFYNEANHLGNTFGQKGPYYGKLGHRGVDFNGHAAGTPIPSWVSGVVVWKQNYSILGNTVIIRRTGGGYVGFCHMRAASPLALGAKVLVGQTVGHVGSTGSASSGPHLHTTLEPTVNIGTANAQDPLPSIRKAVTSAPSTPRKVRKNVTLYYTKKSNKNFFALAGESPGTSANWLETADQELANQLAAQHGPAAFLTNASFESWKAAYLQDVRTTGATVTVNAPPVEFPTTFTGTFG
jgi:Peptidase family M23